MGTNVIPFKKSGKKSTSEGSLAPSTDKIGSVTDIAEKRRELIKSERREVSRTVLSQFVGVFVVLPNLGLQPVSVFDISDSGLSFDLPEDMGEFKIGEGVTMRMYLSHDSYFTFSLDIANVRLAGGAVGPKRHGAIFKKNDDCYDTLFFAKFLESVGKIVRKDTGDRRLGRAD